jgi:peptide/nickel transport system substrate-binding protein
MSDKNGMYNIAGERLLFFDKDLQVRPNVAESWKLNANASEWTFTLRKGMKWSDGKPFTAKDSKWWYDNVLLNKTLTKAIGANWYTAGSDGQRVTMKIETPDDFTVVQKFSHPKPLNHYNMAMSELWTPGHYMAQFHGDLVSDKAALDKTVKDAGMASWDAYYANRADWPLNPDMPVLGPWLPKNPMSDQLFVMERNPYYYQVDKDGNQLPYIDKITHRLYNTPDVFNMWIINGEIDFQQRNVLFGDYTLHKTNEKKGDYTVYLGASDITDMMWINHTAKDPKVAEFFQNKDVRIALSHAINREEINELIYDGLLVPRQFSPPKGAPEYYEKLTTAYIKYDPKLANELLDKAGYSKKDAQGFRLWKDGSGRVSFIVEDNISAGTPAESETQMVVKHWANVGVEAIIKFLDRTIVENHKTNNEIDCRGANASSRTLLPIVDPAFFLGLSMDKTFAQRWCQWRNDPKHNIAEEPPKDHFLREMWAIWDKIVQEPSAAKQHEMFLTIMDVWARELPAPGVVGETPTPFIIKNGLQNLPKSYKMSTSNPTKHGYLIPLQTYFWDEPDKHK